MSQRNLLLFIACGVIVLLIQAVRPNYDVDVFWQVRLGQLALEQGGPVAADPFTATHRGEPVPPVAWLAQIVFAMLYELGGWRLLLAANSTAFTAALVLSVAATRPNEASSRAVLAALALALLVALPHCEIRTQTCGMLAFGSLLALERTDWRLRWKLPLAGAILVLWQNMHPSVTLAVLVFGAMAAAEWIAWFRTGADDSDATSAPWGRTALTVLALAATVATPLGTSIFTISAENAEISRALSISEWMPLWRLPVSGAAMPLWLALGVSALLVLRLRTQLRPKEWAVLLVMGVASVAVFRFALFWAVAMAPIWGRWLTLVLADRQPATTGRARLGIVPSAAVIFGVCTVALGLPWLAGLPVFDASIPLAAAERLEELDIRGTVYNYREWGGPLIFRGDGRWKVTIDGRLYFFPRGDWQRYHAVAAGSVPVEQVERWYAPAAFFLRPDYHARFIERLRASDRWHEVYADPCAMIFVPRTR